MATENMALVLPEQGATDGTWGTVVNAALTLIDSHDHSTGKGVKVTPAGININASLPFAGQSATGIGTLDFNANTDAATSAKVRAFYWDENGELCIRNGSSTKLAITSGAGTSLNSSILGGIEGDYAATSASLYYEDAGKRYLALQSTGPNFWAEVACGDLALFEKASGIVNRVRLKSPASLAASYEVAFPAAVPAATSYVTMDTGGALALRTTTKSARIALSVSRLISGTAPTVQTNETEVDFAATDGVIRIPIQCLASGDTVVSIAAAFVNDGVGTLSVDLKSGATARFSVSQAGIGAVTETSEDDAYTVTATDTFYLELTGSGLGGTENTIESVTITWR